MSASKRGKSKPSKQQSAEQLPPEGEEKKASDSQQDEKYSKSNTVETDLDPTKDREPELTEEDEEQPKSNNDKNRSHFIKDGESELTDEKSKGSSDFSQKSPVQEDRTGPKSVSQSNKQNNNQKCSTTTTTLIIVIGVIVAIGGIITACLISSDKSTPSTDPEWRSKVDPGSYLSDTNQNMIRASLKPILDKHPSREYESISTLLVLSKNEDIAAQLARCVLNLVNKPEKKSTEIDLRSYTGDKTDLDSQLRSWLGSTNPAQAVLLRGIDHIPSKYLLERLRLLFGYCDGENPVISNRLFILTASSTADNDLRQTFKAQLPAEHDFVDALMSRISGHTIYLENDQQSIC